MQPKNHQQATTAARRAGLVRRELLEILAHPLPQLFSLFVFFLVGAVVFPMLSPEPLSHTARILIASAANGFLVYMYGKALIDSLLGK